MRRGRNKMQQQRVEDERERAVTLSKCYIGLFKRAEELATLCGAQVVIILFTIGGKPLSFGSPDVCAVIGKFLNAGRVHRRFATSSNKSKLQALKQELNELNEKLKIEKKQAEMLEEILKASLGGKTYEEYISSIGIDELMKLKYKLEMLKRKLEECRDGSTSGSASSNDEYKVDLSKLGGPEDYLKL